jgi:hypothetical protein
VLKRNITKTYVRVNAKIHAFLTSAVCGDQLQSQAALISEEERQYQLDMKPGGPNRAGAMDMMGKINTRTPPRESNPRRPTRSHLGNDPTDSVQ